MEATAPNREPRHRRLKVLVIDDYRDGAEAFAHLVQEMGHQTAFATTGDSALEFAERMQPEVIFLDLVLPDIEGHELARLLRRLPGLQATRIYVVSAYGTDEDRRRSREAGCDGHYVKPLETAFVETLLGNLPRSR